MLFLQYSLYFLKIICGISGEKLAIFLKNENKEINKGILSLV